MIDTVRLELLVGPYSGVADRRAAIKSPEPLRLFLNAFRSCDMPTLFRRGFRRTSRDDEH